MIDTILLDMGNVLLRFDPALFLDRIGITGADRELLIRSVFRSVQWVCMDRGTLDEPQAERAICANLPQHLHPAVHQLVSCWDMPLLPMPGMEPLVAELHQLGYKLYLLSNASRRQRTYWPRLPVSRCFDGTFLSAEAGVMKPQPEFFQQALAHFRLAPEACFFVDDVPANVAAAQFCGIQGAVFHGDAALLRQQLRAAGIPVSLE